LSIFPSIIRSFTRILAVSRFPQIPAIGVWQRRRITSERGADRAVPHLRAISDDRGRVRVLMTHNTDFGDSYKPEGDDREYFQKILRLDRYCGEIAAGRACSSAAFAGVALKRK